MEKRVLIVEDNNVQLEMLKKLVLEVNPNTVVYTAEDVHKAYQIVLERTIDVFLIDIILDTTMPGDTSGIKFVEKIRDISKYMFTPVLFVTSLEDTTNYAYTDLNCLGYIEKPFDPEAVKFLLERALNFSTARNQDATFCFRKDGILYPIKVRDILYIESINHVVTVYLVNDGTLTVPYKPCKTIIEEVDADCLMRCSRNVIVNKNYITYVDTANRYIMLKDVNKQIEIGITYKKKVLAEFGL